MIRDLYIKAALNGFIVQCGCQTLVAESVDRLVAGIKAYLEDPDKVEKIWMSTGLNCKHTSPQLTAVTEAPIPLGHEIGVAGLRRPTPAPEAYRDLSGGAVEESAAPRR